MWGGGDYSMIASDIQQGSGFQALQQGNKIVTTGRRKRTIFNAEPGCMELKPSLYCRSRWSSTRLQSTRLPSRPCSPRSSPAASTGTWLPPGSACWRWKEASRWEGWMGEY